MPPGRGRRVCAVGHRRRFRARPCPGDPAQLAGGLCLHGGGNRITEHVPRKTLPVTRCYPRHGIDPGTSLAGRTAAAPEVAPTDRTIPVVLDQGMSGRTGCQCRRSATRVLGDRSAHSGNGSARLLCALPTTEGLDRVFAANGLLQRSSQPAWLRAASVPGGPTLARRVVSVGYFATWSAAYKVPGGRCLGGAFLPKVT